MATVTLSIDWEDFGQLYGMYHFGEVTEPRNGAIERQTDIMLEMFDEYDVKATFFILGMLAKYRPSLVKKIKGRGHEIALHGMNHKAMFTLTPEAARKDIADSKKLVADITGEEVFGYRAPFFSIIDSNLYVLEILSELGFEYDSSIFPKKLSRYGIENFRKEDTLYALPSGRQIVELPLTVAHYFKRDWPVSGGGYIRLMPRMLVNKVFRDISAQGNNSMIYMHPYEFDTEKISVASNYPDDVISTTFKVQALNLRWNIFRNSVRGKIKQLLQQYEFITCKQKSDNVKKNGIGAELLGCTE